MAKPFNNLFSKKTFYQFFRYALNGIAINFLGYLAYLFLTNLWGSPKLIMTALYLPSALITFFVNRRLTFQHDGKIGEAGLRFMLAQILGYLLNLFLLIILVDWLELPHQIVQAIAILIVAIFLFLMLRIFVFHPITNKTKEMM
jgi:putative flippase GtrA